MFQSLINIFSKKSSISENLVVLDDRMVKNVNPNLMQVHPDLQDLLWIADGPHKNYQEDKQYEYIKMNNMTIKISFECNEPSLLYLSHPITPVEMQCVDRPPYYPTYSSLSPQQKFAYWTLLGNPYDSIIDVGFVFILYYGLERYLFGEQYEKALDVILKLRNVHNNPSFQKYSGDAIILTCINKQRADLALVFMDSLDKDYKLNFSDNLFLLCKYSLNIPLTAKDIIRLSKTFEFTNMNYINKYPEIFEEKLKLNLEEQYKSEDILLSSIINKKMYEKLRLIELPIFANVSMSNNTLNIPLLSDSFKFKKEIHDLLQKTHDDTKETLASLRKNNKLPVESKKYQKQKVIECFDEGKEIELLKNLKSCRNNYMDKHFINIEIQNFYYKFRDIDSIYIQKCIEYCLIDINDLEKMQKQYYDHEREDILQFQGAFSPSELNERLASIKSFNGNIPAFKRLSIIYEKRKDYHKALEVCDMAIKYYRSLNLDVDYASDEFEQRKHKILNKMSK